MIRHLITLFALLYSMQLLGQSWEEAQKNKAAELDLYWYTSKPFIYEDENGNLTGIEYEMLEAFKTYVQDKYQIELRLNWIKAKDFSNVLDRVRSSESKNLIGVSALSITDERKQFANFSDVYLPDITVLVSSEGSPIVGSYEEINQMITSMQAVTIRDTKYELLLNDLEQQLNIKLDMLYIESEGNILDALRGSSNRFGFIDLPVYLMLIKDGTDLTRQNFFTVKGDGYAFMVPSDSDWDQIISEFLKDPKNKVPLGTIISGFLGEELFRFIENIYSGQTLSTSLLTMEKEMQLALIKNANLKLEEEQAIRTILMIGISIIGVFLLVIGYLFYRNKRNNKILIGQKDQIVKQEEDIRLKNESLMNRNAQLLNINEEKNNLVKILAHDIRSPLSQIIMICEILQNPSDEAEDMTEDLLKQAGASAERINEMVAKILDMDNLENDKLKILRERVDIGNVLKDIEDRYLDQATQKGIAFEVKSCTKNNVIRTDHLLLTLVLENLVSNALKFSEPNTTVILEADCQSDGVILKVSDQGPGFSENDKRLLFNRFQKLSAKPTAGEPSIGLGLSIVKKYVNDMGGEIWLESEQGNGSTFFVKLGI